MVVGGTEERNGSFLGCNHKTILSTVNPQTKDNIHQHDV